MVDSRTWMAIAGGVGAGLAASLPWTRRGARRTARAVTSAVAAAAVTLREEGSSRSSAGRAAARRRERRARRARERRRRRRQRNAQEREREREPGRARVRGPWRDWRAVRDHARGTGWAAAALTGFAAAAFSSAIFSLAAPRLGRDARRDWASKGTVLTRTSGQRRNPGLRDVAAGLLVHKASKVSWAVLYRTTGAARMPAATASRRWLGVDLPYAFLASAVEYWVVLPWLQPLVRMRIPYGVVAAIHVAAGSTYGLHSLFERLLAGERPRGEGRRTLAGLLGALGAFTGLEVWARSNGEPRWPLGSERSWRRTRDLLRILHAHHQAGIRMARLAMERAERRQVRRLAAQMLGELEAECDLMRDWWQSWFEGALPGAGPDELARLPGALEPELLEHLGRQHGRVFEEEFLAFMADHQRGALTLSRSASRSAADPRVRAFAASVHHLRSHQQARLRELLNESAVGPAPASGDGSEPERAVHALREHAVQA
ncbi:MAG: DUF305 domain-containing protein [Candidatus Krumholzibacteriia bacterium]